MKVMPFQDLACPLDGSPLARGERGWSCAAGHAFDLAREGYVNLLPVQHKRSRDPGDDKAMVAARRRFLEAGHYQPVAAALAEHTLADAEERLSCLDAGCGEGHYLRELSRIAAPQPGTLALLGLDISKWAVRAAAKRGPLATWVVGSNAKLPVLPETLDRVLCGFGFPVYGEFARVLRPEGRLLQLDPGPDHLRELREVIYPRLKPTREPMLKAAGFKLLEQLPLRHCIELTTPEQIADLLLMTPHIHRASAEGRARAAALTQLSLTVDVRLTSLRRV